MAQHGNRSEKHEVEIRNSVNAGNAEYEIEQAKQRKAVEDYNENKRHDEKKATH